MTAPRSKPGFLVRRVTDTRYFFLDLNPDPAEDWVVVGGGYERCLPEYHVQRSDFPFYSVEYVLKGRGRFRTEQQEVDINAGSVYVYGPGIDHEILSDPDDCLVKYFFDFTGPRGAALLQDVSLQPGSCVQVSIPRQLMEICELLLQNGTAENAYTQRICVTLLELLILKSAENLRSDTPGRSRAFSTYLRCRQQLEQHYLEIRSLDELAARCHLEKPYLCRLFRRFDGETPYQRLIRLKMNRAAELLSSGDRLVKEVANELGYDDPYHFSRVFKKVYEISPEHFLYRSARLG